MIIRVCDFNDLINRLNGRKMVCVGAGRLISELCDECSDMHFESYISYIVDNNSGLWGTSKNLNGKAVSVLPPCELYSENTKEIALLVTAGGQYIYELYQELDKKIELAHTECYFATLNRAFARDNVSYNADTVLQGWRANQTQVIPKKLHYCWIGGNPLPKSAEKCIDTWKEYCPDYQIIKWDESNYDFFKNQYMQEAYEAKKWGFVPDYARLDIIYNEGGIYLDTDVEIVKPFDELLYNTAFCGFESAWYIALGLGFGAVSHCEIIRELRDSYDTFRFVKGDGSLDITASPVLNTATLTKCGLKRDGTFQVIQDMTVYPATFFSPLSCATGVRYQSDDTYSIHLYDGSWLTEKTKTSAMKFYNLYQIALENEKKYSGGILRLY